MKIKAVIMGADRTNTVVKIKPKKLEAKTFRHAGDTYMVDPDRVMITWERRGVIGPKKYFATYYYMRGVPRPLPVPFFEHKPKKGDQYEFPRIVNNGIPSDELAAIFNPWFYRTIGPIDTAWYKDLGFWVTVGVGIGVFYLIYTVASMQGQVEEIRQTLESVRIAAQAAQAASGGSGGVAVG